jgi:hypothetical protein
LRERPASLCENTGWPEQAASLRQEAEAVREPVMLFDVQEQRIYAFPYEAYRAE